MLVASNFLMLADLALEKAVGGTLTGALLGLFTGAPILSRTTLLGDLTEADFSGYARTAAIVWGTPFLDSLNIPTMLGGLKTFTAAGGPPFVSNVITGAFIVDSGGTNLLFCEKIDPPVVVGAAGVQVNYLPQVQAVSQLG